MNPNEALIHNFYTAFAKKDIATMQACYHPDATFSDPVFQNLSSERVKAMWEMLIKAGSDLTITYSDVEADGSHGKCHWEAWYTFSRTGRKVHNIIDTKFEFKDGKIFRHRDHFNFWRWSKMALGAPGLLLGWTSLIRNKIRSTAAQNLAKFIAKKRSAAMHG